MTQKALEYCGRGIVQYLDGDTGKFLNFVQRAMLIYRDTLCVCGGGMVDCRYGNKHAKLCTHCGSVWQDGRLERKCIVRGGNLA